MKTKRIRSILYYREHPDDLSAAFNSQNKQQLVYLFVALVGSIAFCFGQSQAAFWMAMHPLVACLMLIIPIWALAFMARAYSNATVLDQIQASLADEQLAANDMPFAP